MATFENRSVVVSDTEGNNATVTPAGELKVDGSDVTQPVSAVSLPLPVGAATAALQTQPGVDIGDVTVNNGAGVAAVNIQDGGNSITVDGPLTDVQLRASAVPISAAALPLPTGAATEATLATLATEATLQTVQSDTASIDTSTSSLDTKFDATLSTLLNTLGQKNMAGSAPVVIASNQSAIPVTGTVTANNASVGVNGVAAPASSTQVGGTNNDGTLEPVAVRGSAPSGAELGFVTRNIPSGTQPVSAVSLPLPVGAATAALQTQPGVDIGDVTVNNGAGVAAVNIQDGGNSITVDGPLTDVQLRASAVPISAAALPLPTGAATEATLATLASAANQTNGTQQTQIVQGGNTAIVSAAGALKVDGSAVTQPVSAAALPLPAGAATAANQTTIGNQTTKLNDGTNTAAVKAASTAPLATDPALVVTLSPNGNTVNATFTPSGTQDVNLTKVAGAAVTTQAAGEQLVAVEGRAANGAAAAGNPVLAAGVDASSNVARLQLRTAPPVGTVSGTVVRPVAAQTGTQTSVPGSAANVTLLAANTARLGATLYNDGTQPWFVKLGATASTSSFSIRLAAQSYYELPYGYTGQIDAIQSVANGNLRVTELV